MTVALESEIVATRYDAKARQCFYTIERDGKRWTIALPREHFDKCGTKAGHLIQRRNLLAAALEVAMRGKPDA